MVDVRDVASAHIAAAELAEASHTRFLLSSPRAVSRARLLKLLAARYPSYEIADGGEPPPEEGLRHLLCSKNTERLLGLRLRNPDDSLLDMAEAMLELGAVQPKLKAAAT